MVSEKLDSLTLQHFFTVILSKQSKCEIFEELNVLGNETDHARFISVAKPHTGDFLLACPKTSCTTFKSTEFIHAVRMRLGANLPSVPTRCSCAKRPVLDGKGTHLLSCAKGGTLIHRHNAIQQDVLVLATSAGVQASILSADVLLLNNAASDMRRGDLLLPEMGKDERDLVVDFTITHPTCPSYVSATRNDPDSSIRRANNRKNLKYKNAAETQDKTFMPMALECYGALSKDFLFVINKLCEKRAKLTDTNSSVVMNYWYRRISCTLHKGNSRAISKRILDITQASYNLHDEYHDNMIDHEYNNIDTMISYRD